MLSGRSRTDPRQVLQAGIHCDRRDHPGRDRGSRARRPRCSAARRAHQTPSSRERHLGDWRQLDLAATEGFEFKNDHVVAWVPETRMPQPQLLGVAEPGEAAGTESRGEW
jgi:hypothetical protein